MLINFILDFHNIYMVKSDDKITLLIQVLQTEILSIKLDWS